MERLLQKYLYFPVQTSRDKFTAGSWALFCLKLLSHSVQQSSYLRPSVFCHDLRGCIAVSNEERWGQFSGKKKKIIKGKPQWKQRHGSDSSNQAVPKRYYYFQNPLNMWRKAWIQINQLSFKVAEVALWLLRVLLECISNVSFRRLKTRYEWITLLQINHPGIRGKNFKSTLKWLRNLIPIFRIDLGSYILTLVKSQWDDSS